MEQAKVIDGNAPPQVAIETLPEYWVEDPPPPPDRAAWIPWPLAILMVPLLWMFPKRMGLHFARVAWPGVIIGHLAWTLYGIGSVALAFFAPRTGLPGYIAQAFQPEAQRGFWPVTLSEAIRSPAALLATGIVEQSASSREQFLLLIGGSFLAVAGIGAIGGGLLIPWAAGGERRWNLFLRCAKLTLWSTTSVVVSGMVLQVAALMMTEPQTPRMGTELDDIAWIFAPLGVAFWLWVWMRSGFRYAGAPKGPDFEPRRPLCEGCGYVLTGLAPAGNCPECGRSVESSMPTNRHMPAFAAAGTRRRRFAGYFRTLLGVLFDADFFQRIRLRNGFAPARRFALWSAALTGPAAFAAYCLSHFLLPDSGLVPPILSIHFPQALLIAWVGFALLVIVVISLLQLTALIRPGAFRARATVVFYASAWTVSLAATAAVTLQVLIWTSEEMAFWIGWHRVRPAALLSGVVATAVCGVLAAQVVVLQRRVRQALCGVRFTNS